MTGFPVVGHGHGISITARMGSQCAYFRCSGTMSSLARVGHTVESITTTPAEPEPNGSGDSFPMSGAGCMNGKSIMRPECPLTRRIHGLFTFPRMLQIHLENLDDVPLRKDDRYEIWRGISEDGGLRFRWDAVTKDSKADNLRPVVPEGHGKSGCLLWLRRSYQTYQDYQMALILRIL